MGAFPNSIQSVSVDSNNINFVTDFFDSMLFSYDKSVLYFVTDTFYGNFKMPYQVKIIRECAFQNNTKITEVVFDDRNQLEEIKFGAFWNSSIKSIRIPASVKKIGLLAFADCCSLTKINYEGTVEQWEDINKEEYWDAGTGTCKIYCTDGTIIKHSNN